MNQRLGMLLLSGLAVLALQGCRHCCKRGCCPPPPPPPITSGYPCPPCVNSPFVRPAHPLTPIQGQRVPDPVPPGAIVQAPQPPPTTVVPDVRGYAPPSQPPTVQPPPVQQPWQPSPEARVQLQGPEPIAPQSPEPPTAKPGVTENRTGTPPLPVGIPQFSPVKPRVATGLKPSAIEGLDWLQANGYRTIIHLRRPGEDDTADRRQFEDKRGLKYLSLEVPLDPLPREVVEQFNTVVTDAAGQPVFVYDRDGALAGGLWYLHFRIVDGLSDQEAREKAAPLGFKPDQGGEYAQMALAVQKYLANLR